MYRLLAAGVTLLWASAMAALFVRDVWPAWSSQDAPPMGPAQVASLPHRQEQYGLYRVGGARIGTAWSELRAAPERTTIRGTIMTVPMGLLPALRIETATDFDPAGGLDSFSLRVHGVPDTRISVYGERRGIYFPVEMHLGTFHRQASLDASATRLIGDAVRPFSYLPDLHVGQSWRMQVLDPMTAALGGKTRFNAVVARVTRTETIEHLGQATPCFVVETSDRQAIAWVDAAGRVLVQETQVPGLGRLRVQQEPYREAARVRARRHIPDARDLEP